MRVRRISPNQEKHLLANKIQTHQKQHCYMKMKIFVQENTLAKLKQGTGWNRCHQVS